MSEHGHDQEQQQYSEDPWRQLFRAATGTVILDARDRMEIGKIQFRATQYKGKGVEAGEKRPYAEFYLDVSTALAIAKFVCAGKHIAFPVQFGGGTSADGVTSRSLEVKWFKGQQKEAWSLSISTGPGKQNDNGGISPDETRKAERTQISIVIDDFDMIGYMLMVQQRIQAYEQASALVRLTGSCAETERPPRGREAHSPRSSQGGAPAANRQPLVARIQAAWNELGRKDRAEFRSSEGRYTHLSGMVTTYEWWYPEGFYNGTDAISKRIADWLNGADIEALQAYLEILELEKARGESDGAATYQG